MTLSDSTTQRLANDRSNYLSPKKCKASLSKWAKISIAKRIIVPDFKGQTAAFFFFLRKKSSNPLCGWMMKKKTMKFACILWCAVVSRTDTMHSKQTCSSVVCLHVFPYGLAASCFYQQLGKEDLGLFFLIAISLFIHVGKSLYARLFLCCSVLSQLKFQRELSLSN